MSTINGRNVKVIRAALGMTQTQFSYLLGVSLTSISRWERASEVRVTSLQRGILLAAGSVAERDGTIGSRLIEGSEANGWTFAVHLLLSEYFGTK